MLGRTPAECGDLQLLLQSRIDFGTHVLHGPIAGECVVPPNLEPKLVIMLHSQSPKTCHTRQTDRETGRQAGRQTSRQTNRQTESLCTATVRSFTAVSKASCCDVAALAC